MQSNISDAGSDVVVIDQDDISNYNPDNILPLSADVIATIRQWLQPTAYDDPFGEYRKHLASHAAGTGAWITSSATYREWLQSQELGTLWVKGIPGSGKSVIAAQLVNHLATEHPGTPVLYFFFRQIIDANHAPTALLRDWLDQVLIYSPPLQIHLQEYVQAGRSLDSLSMEDLWRDLRLALRGLPNNVYCVADALDEMDQGHDGFLRSLAALGQWVPGKIKVLMTSRPVASVETALRKAEKLQIRLDETVVDQDIAIFVQKKLESVSIADSDRALILDAIPGRANGLFLYARLAMDAFLEPGADVKDVLKKLPRDLNDMYTNLLRDHALRSGTPPDLQRLILQYATHATRPLRLLEVADMLEATHLSRTEKNLRATKDVVRTACGPLLEILPDETICVVHHSFTEYLIGSTRSDSSVDYPVLMPGPTHETLALACLSYLEFGFLSHVISEGRVLERHYNPFRNDKPTPEEVELRLKYPFFQYATSSWHVHVIKSINAGHDQKELNKAIRRFFDDDRRLDAWLTLSWRDHGVGGMTQLHVAAKLGLELYGRELLEMDNIEVDAQDSGGRTPLWWAASSGHAGVVHLLIQAGANPDQDDNYNGLKPLHKAASANHAEVVKVLLEAGVDPMTKKVKEDHNMGDSQWISSTGDTPFMYACTYGHLEAVDTFLAFVSEPTVVNQALRWAAQAGRAAIVRRILQHPNVDVNLQQHRITPLFLACGSGSEDTVSALLDAGADPNLYTILDSTNTPFRTADSSHCHSPLYQFCKIAGRSDVHDDSLQAIFSLLVDAGVDLHQRDEDGANALHWTVNSPVLTRLLLDAGVDANVATSDGATPLHKTTSVEAMCLLINLGGADINKRDREGKTPLFSLIEDKLNGTDNLCKFLEFGPDCSVVDINGNNALHYLLQRTNYMDLPTPLRSLLALGADPNCRNNLGKLPLHTMKPGIMASDQVLDLLLAAGVDMNARDSQGLPLLFRAIRDRPEGPPSSIQPLVGKGASLAIRDSHGRTLLHEAIKARALYGNQTDSFLDFLLARGLDPSQVDNCGNNLLHELAMQRGNYESYGDGNRVDLWKQLLSLGLNLYQRNYVGRTPLHILCCAKHRFRTPKPSSMLPIDFVISEMKNSGLRTVDVVDNAGITPLHLAATVSDIYTQKLLDAGADPTRATMEGRSPLHLAAQSRVSNIVGVLLDALYKQQDPHGENAGDKGISILPRGSWYREREPQFPGEVINALDKSTLCMFDRSGWTPLSYACRSGMPETVALLLQAGADVTVGSIIEASIAFEGEQFLWGRDQQRGVDLDTGGILLADSSRPLVSDQNDTTLEYHRTRIDDIFEMLLDKGINFDPFDGGSDSFNSYFISKAFEGGKDYTVGCLATARTLQNESKTATTQHSGSVNYAIHRAHYIQGAALRSLTDFEEFRVGGINNELFRALMLRREYSVVRELSRAGADFFEQGNRYQGNHFGVLVKFGFASLAKSIIHDLYARSKTSGSPKPSLSFRSRGTTDGSEHMSHLLMAVRRDLPNMEMVRLLVEDCGVDINELHIGRGENITDSPLLSAAKGEQWWHAALAVPYFIERSADLNIRNYLGQTPLHVAMHRNSDGSRGFFSNDVVRALVKAGADVQAADAQGQSCLAYAGQDIALVTLLIESGAKADPHALFAAIAGNNYEVLQTLLSSGADPNMRRPEVAGGSKLVNVSEGQLFPVHYAARTDGIGSWIHLRAEDKAVLKGVRGKMVAALLAHGADPFATFVEQLPSLDGYHIIEPMEYAHPRDGRLRSRLRKTPVRHAAPSIPEGQEQSTILHDLVEKSALVEPFLNLATLDVNTRDSNGRSLLLAACKSKDGPDTLVEIPPSPVEGSDSTSVTSQSILRCLLSKGADPFARDNLGKNALHHMFEHRDHYAHYDLEDSLSFMANTYPALVNQKDNLGNTPLHLTLRPAAGRRGGAEAVMELLRAGADPLLVDGEGNSSLHIIAGNLNQAEFRKLFKELLSRGCDINARNQRGETPLFSSNLAFSKFYPSHPNGTVSALDEEAVWDASGADFSASDNTGRGLLHVAAQGDATRFQKLMDRGLDPMMEDEKGETPLDVAAAYGNRSVLALFEKKE
ncbi:ankyrin repeat-containing domain protein [Nemania sp. NC0429]|nr:ankyrin repeat-containing domain protein [Nemania sp. NC0429]